MLNDLVGDLGDRLLLCCAFDPVAFRGPALALHGESSMLEQGDRAESPIGADADDRLAAVTVIGHAFIAGARIRWPGGKFLAPPRASALGMRRRVYYLPILTHPAEGDHR
jgi:hypothetical protein